MRKLGFREVWSKLLRAKARIEAQSSEKKTVVVPLCHGVWVCMCERERGFERVQSPTFPLDMNIELCVHVALEEMGVGRQLFH